MTGFRYPNTMNPFNISPEGNGKASAPDKGFRCECGKWIGVVLASGIGCGAIIAAPPAADAVQVAAPVSHVMLHRLPSHDSEPEHPEGPDQTFDGPAALYSVTAATSHLTTISLPAVRKLKLMPIDGGAVPTSTVVGPWWVTPQMTSPPLGQPGPPDEAEATMYPQAHI